jgi:hypothetical protein
MSLVRIRSRRSFVALLVAVVALLGAGGAACLVVSHHHEAACAGCGHEPQHDGMGMTGVCELVACLMVAAVVVGVVVVRVRRRLSTTACRFAVSRHVLRVRAPLPVWFGPPRLAVATVRLRC